MTYKILVNHGSNYFLLGQRHYNAFVLEESLKCVKELLY